MFEFPESIDTLDSVPDEYRVAYDKGADGKFALKDAFKPFATGLKGNFASLTTAKKDLAKAQSESASRRQVIKAFEDWAKESGIEFDDKKILLDAVKEHITTLQASAKNGTELKVNLDKLKADYERAANAIRVESETKVTKMQASLERHMVGDAAKGALAKMKGSIELLLPIVRSQTKVVQEGDEYVARVVDSDNTVRIDPKTGQAMTVDGLVAEMKANPAYSRAFESETKGGNGSQQQTQQRQQAKVAPQGEKSSKDKIAAGLASRAR